MTRLSLPRYKIFSSVARASMPTTLSMALAWATVVRSLLKTDLKVSSRWLYTCTAGASEKGELQWQWE